MEIRHITKADLGEVALLLDEVMLMAERFELPGLAKRCGEAIELLGVGLAPFLPDAPAEEERLLP